MKFRHCFGIVVQQNDFKNKLVKVTEGYQQHCPSLLLSLER